jgi:hypothetical protein
MNGIGATHSSRGSSSTGVPYIVKNLNVHNNTITQTTGMAAGIAVYNADNSVFTNMNNTFQANTYRLANSNGVFYDWMNTGHTRSEWTNYGMDISGSWQ